ncbi:MAG: hypothetical protein CSB23_03000 [Deltaproteobacteria bacterium]|nr:MAG: hypothetical protein CSB23_03000 [Deltaproteobacteria bacterium]
MDHLAINKARVVYYSFFASFFAFDFGKDHYDRGVHALEALIQSPIDEQSALAFSNLKRRCKNGGFAAFARENNNIFSDPSSEPIPTTASFYDENRDDGRQRLRMIDYVIQSKYRRNAESFKEHEDHIEFILLFLARLIEEQTQGVKPSGDLAKAVFTNILNPMLDDFTDNLFNHRQSFIYKQLALALRSFTELERVYLDVGKPTKTNNRKRTRAEEIQKKGTEQGCIRMNSSFTM